MAKIMLLSGSPASGKSTVGRALAETFPLSVHLKVDEIRESVVGGFQAPGGWTPEAVRQFRLARQVASHWARSYANEGFTVIIDDVCVPEAFSEHYAALSAQPDVAQVLLHPNQATLARRITRRGGPYVELFLTVLPDMQRYIGALPKDQWLVVDSSELNVEQTVQAVLARLGATL